MQRSRNRVRNENNTCRNIYFIPNTNRSIRYLLLGDKSVGGVMAKQDWVWQPHAGHFILGDKCKFVLNTYLGNGYLVSTVGELWNDRDVRRIHASIHDPDWHRDNDRLKGDTYDSAYFKRFGFDDLGVNRKYETMVFKARVAKEDDCDSCQYVIESGHNEDFDGYETGFQARNGHMEMCKKWSRKRI
jgi:hypothetical protein